MTGVDFFFGVLLTVGSLVLIGAFYPQCQASVFAGMGALLIFMMVMGIIIGSTLHFGIGPKINIGKELDSHGGWEFQAAFSAPPLSGLLTDSAEMRHISPVSGRFESCPRYHQEHTAGCLSATGRMCFQDQLGDALDVVVTAVWALVDGDPVASEEHPGFGTGE